MNDKSTITGGCACGAIRYSHAGDPVLQVNCHCRDCQRASGTAFASFSVVWKDSFESTGPEPNYYVRQADSGNTMQRGYCPECGSPVWLLEPHRPKLVFLHAASLDDPGRHHPAMDIFTDSAHSWDVMDPATENFPQMPPVPDDFGT